MEIKIPLVADITMDAILVRCGCPDEQTGYERHGRLQQPCPTPKSTKQLGEIAREHFEGSEALQKYREWSAATGSTIPHVEAKLEKQLKEGKR